MADVGGGGFRVGAVVVVPFLSSTSGGGVAVEGAIIVGGEARVLGYGWGLGRLVLRVGGRRLPPLLAAPRAGPGPVAVQEEAGLEGHLHEPTLGVVEGSEGHAGGRYVDEEVFAYFGE